MFASIDIAIHSFVLAFLLFHFDQESDLCYGAGFVLFVVFWNNALVILPSSFINERFFFGCLSSSFLCFHSLLVTHNDVCQYSAREGPYHSTNSLKVYFSSSCVTWRSSFSKFCQSYQAANQDRWKARSGDNLLTTLVPRCFKSMGTYVFTIVGFRYVGKLRQRMCRNSRSFLFCNA